MDLLSCVCIYLYLKVIQPPTTAGSKIVEEMDFSIAEPDLMIHSIFSQETVITSTCGCLSSHELSDSSDSETFGTTLELSTTVKNVELKKKIVSEDEDFEPLKTNEDRITKRRIISESDINKNKKIKIESKEEKLNTLCSIESISRLSVDDSEDTSLPPLPRLSLCRKMVERLLPEQLIQNCQNLDLVASVNEDSELPSVALENNIYTSVKPKIEVSKDNHQLEEAEEYPRISALQHISEDSNKIRPVIELSMEEVSTTKTAKRATKDLKHKLQTIKKSETNTKGDVTNLKHCRDKSRDSSKPAAIIQSTIIDNGLLKNDKFGGLDHSKKIQITQDPVHIFKPPSPPAKLAVKWKPPGKSVISQLLAFQILSFSFQR